jgi:outer membrane lipoprotein-sorting protein
MMLLCGVDNLLTSSCVQQTHRTTITDVSEDLRHVHDLRKSIQITVTSAYTKQRSLKLIKKTVLVSVGQCL